jgi:acetoin utilization protein AcuB
MLMPTLKRYMTREPYSISSHDSLSRAKALMRGHLIRHLPVIDGDKLVGVLSDRDIAVVEAVPGVDLAHVEVARVMEPR